PLITEGGTLSLTAPVSGGTPPPRYHWYRNGIRIAETSDPSLVRNNISAQDVGIYSIIASNNIGISSNVVAHVTVEVPLQLTFSASKNAGALQFRILGAASHTFYIQGT